MARNLSRLYTANFQKRPVITLTVTNCLLNVIGDGAAQMLPVFLENKALDWDYGRTFRFFAFGAAMGPVAAKWNHFIEFAFPLRPPSKIPIRDAEKDTTPSSKVLGEIPHLHQRIIQPQATLPADSFSPPLVTETKQEAQIITLLDPAHSSQSKEEFKQSPAGRVSYFALFKRLVADQLLMAPLGLGVFITAMGIMEGKDLAGIQEKFKSLYIPIIIKNWQIWPILQLFNFRFMPLKFRVPFQASCGIIWNVFVSWKQAQSAPNKVEP